MNPVGIRLGQAALAMIVVGLVGLFFLTLANLVNAFALGDSTQLVRVGWVIITIALGSSVVLSLKSLMNRSRLGQSQ